jgi:hypothetical protein
VLPCFNEQDCLKEPYRRTTAACEKVPHDYEIVLVEDGLRRYGRSFNASQARASLACTQMQPRPSAGCYRRLHGTGGASFIDVDLVGSA